MLRAIKKTEPQQEHYFDAFPICITVFLIELNSDYTNLIPYFSQKQSNSLNCTVHCGV